MNATEASRVIRDHVTTAQAAAILGLDHSTDRPARCPFHKDSVGTLHFYGNKGWHCFGCHKGGTVVDYVMRIRHLGFIDALIWIDIRFKLNLRKGEKWFTTGQNSETLLYLADYLSTKNQERKENISTCKEVQKWAVTLKKAEAPKEG